MLSIGMADTFDDVVLVSVWPARVKRVWGLELEVDKHLGLDGEFERICILGLLMVVGRQ